jgi:hypothetical protein
LTAGAVLLGIALLPLGATLYPRELDSNPGLDELIGGDAHREPTEIEWLLVLSLDRSIRSDARLVQVKALLVRGGSGLIAAAVVIIASRFIYALEAAAGPAAAPVGHALS